MSQNSFVLFVPHDDANAIFRRKPLIAVPPFISRYIHKNHSELLSAVATGDRRRYISKVTVRRANSQHRGSVGKDEVGRLNRHGVISISRRSVPGSRPAAGDHDARVRQAETLAFRPAVSRNAPIESPVPYKGKDVCFNKLHGVIDGHPRSNYAARELMRAR